MSFREFAPSFRRFLRHEKSGLEKTEKRQSFNLLECLSGRPAPPLWNTPKADINSQLSCPINCRNWLPRIIVVPHKESKRPYRRVPRFSHHLNHDNLSVPRVFLNFWGTTNMGKTVFLPTWTFSRGPVTPIWNTQKAHLNSQLWCPINFRNNCRA